MKEERNIKEEKSKLDKLVEMWKDKRGRAKIQLCLYGIFFIGVIIFTRVLNTTTSKTQENNPVNKSFLVEVNDNYGYDIEINIDNNIYKYYGEMLGNNGKITRIVEDTEDHYFIMNNKYYILDENSNYILTTKEEIYPYIDYMYLNIDLIKEFIAVATIENNIYKVKLSDLILNNNSEEYITITVDEENKTLEIDYTNLFKVDNEKLTKETVKITYNDINNITSLEE